MNLPTENPEPGRNWERPLGKTQEVITHMTKFKQMVNGPETDFSALQAHLNELHIMSYRDGAQAGFDAGREQGWQAGFERGFSDGHAQATIVERAAVVQKQPGLFKRLLGK